MKTCVLGCPRKVQARGYCVTCYTRLHRQGVFQPGYIVKGTDRERFNYVCPIADTDDCIIWPRNTDRDGYGRYRDGRAHRWSYLAFNGPIPDGMVVMHSCDNPPCVNPRHLSVGTVRENTQQAVDRGLMRSWRPRPVCGSPANYRRGCRCDECRTAATTYARERRQAKRAMAREVTP